MIFTENLARKGCTAGRDVLRSGVMDTELTLGEYLRRLRRGKKWNLQRVSQVTGLSYTHLSRVENDSAVPKADTVSKLAEALDGDLIRMLELADCLPQQILDRMRDREEQEGAPTLRRAADRFSPEPESSGQRAEALTLARAAGVPEREISDVATLLVEFLRLDHQQRSIVAGVIQGLHGVGDATEG